MKEYLITVDSNINPQPINLENIIGYIKVNDTPKAKYVQEMMKTGGIYLEPRGYKYTDENTGEERYEITSFDAVWHPIR